MIKLFYPFVHPEAITAVGDVLRGTQLAEGPGVVAFEDAVREYTGKQHVVALNSGTSALELAYELAGVGVGDEVVTPALTCTATNLPILHRGGVPVFADTTDKLTVDPVDMERRITSRTKALVYVHFGGSANTLDAVLELGRQYNLPVIEDAAQSFGGSPSGHWGKAQFTAVSLQAIKTLTSGDGGLLFTESEELYHKAKRLRWFGYDRQLKQKMGDTDLVEAGYKYHMNDISAAIGLANLHHLDEMLDARSRVAAQYTSASLPILTYPWLAILVHERVPEIAAALNLAGIESSPHHYRNDKYTVFGGRRGDLPMMDRMEHRFTLLPFHHMLTEEDVDKVIEVVKRFVYAR